MTIAALNKRYGPHWHTDPPPEAQPFMLDGVRDLGVMLTIPTRSQPLIRYAPPQGDSPLIVIHRMIIKCSQWDKEDLIVESVSDAALIGQISFGFEQNGTPRDNTQFPQLDGYIGSDIPAQQLPRTIGGLSLLGEHNLSHAPLIFAPSATWSLMLYTQNALNGSPIPDNYVRAIQGKVLGFSLPIPID